MKISRSLLAHVVFFVFFILHTSYFILHTPPVRAQQNDPNELTKQIQEYEQKLKELAGQKQTLSNTIAYLNTQIGLTQTKIAQTEQTLVVLAREIDDLVARIDRLNTSLDTLSTILIERVRKNYKQERVEPLYLFFASTGFTDFVNQVKYIRAAQLHDRELLLAMERTRSTYDIQKQELVQKQDEVEALNTTLKKQQNNLVVQQKDKERLLEITKNDERKYQELLDQARAEFLAIQAILAGEGTETRVKDVNSGDQIASIIQGKSCNSSGTHLHFSVVKNKQTENPFNYLQTVEVENCSGEKCGDSTGDAFNPSGSSRWPIDASVKFTQGYGKTWAVEHYPWLPYDFHDGVDINNPSTKVYAINQGVLYRGSYTGSSGCSLRYVRVDHGDNLSTYYLHVNYI